MKYSPWRRALNLPHGALPGALHTQLKQIYTNISNQTNAHNYKHIQIHTNILKLHLYVKNVYLLHEATFTIIFIFRFHKNQ